MKTSNKLLIAAFAVMVIIMISATIDIQYKLKDYSSQNQNNTEQADSIVVKFR